LACFMLSNNIKIKSKRFDCIDTFIVDVEKDNEYVVFNKSSEKSTSFTEITLDENFLKYLKLQTMLKHILSKPFSMMIYLLLFKA